jgi:hypothetical protein
VGLDIAAEEKALALAAQKRRRLAAQRKCTDKPFLEYEKGSRWSTSVLVGRIKRLLARHHGGVSQVEDMAIELISQACEQRLRDLIERLAGASARRRQLAKSGLRTAPSARQPSVAVAAASGGGGVVVDGDAMELDTSRSGVDAEKGGEGAKPSILINDMIYVLEREVNITTNPLCRTDLIMRVTISPNTTC